MVEIEFSVMEGAPGEANKLLPLLQAFENQHHIHVNLTGINWAKGWNEIAKFGIYGNGPDVSAIGTTWIGSLASMQALRPYTQEQIDALGGADIFFESIWQTGFLRNDPTLWAIPWVGDTTVFYYWKNALEKAGIQDFEAAFATDSALVTTLEKLRKNGIAHPLALNVTDLNVITHEAALWVWNAGGDFVSPDGRQVTFNQPAAMQGWKNYFGLQPYISPQWLETTSASGDSFLAGESAIQLGGPYFGVSNTLAKQAELGKELMSIAPVPGTTFVGGASFVIWQYSPRYEEAFQLVKFLSSQPTSIPAAPHSNELPTRQNSIQIPSVKNNIFHRTYLHAMQSGRSFPTMRLWGMIEDKLIATIVNIWTERLADPDQDLDECLHRHFDPLAKRLNMTLGN